MNKEEENTITQIAVSELSEKMEILFPESFIDRT